MTNELKKAIETVKSYLDMDSDVDSEYLNAQRTIIQALESQRWIPVDEQNPEETGEYLTTIKWYNDKNGYNYAVVKRDYYADVETWNDSLVIAWIPLPQPYKAESETKNGK